MKTYKINFCRVKFKLTVYIVYLILAIILLWIVFNNTSYLHFFLLSIPFIFIIGILNIYPYVLTKKYLQYDRDTILEIDVEEKMIYFYRKEETLKILFSEIEKIYYCHFPNAGITPYYFKIVLFEGKSIVITSLIIRDFSVWGFKEYDVSFYNLFLPNEKS